MIVRNREELINTEQHVETKAWTSTRFFIKKDGLGFSFHETINEPGIEQVLWYKNHIEVVFVAEGTAEITNLATGERHHLKAGSAYALTGDKHIFRAITKVKSYCVFMPGLNGDEIPDEDGSYPAD
jgi:L-ectoine synthase